MPIRLSVTAERWPIAGSFTISRGAKTEAEVVVATLADGEHAGRDDAVETAPVGLDQGVPQQAGQGGLNRDGVRLAFHGSEDLWNR